MDVRTNINGIILAGGKSRRMGRSKAFLEFNGKPFIAYCIEALKPLVQKIYIVSDDPRFDAFDVERIEDDIKKAGPLAGLYTGLKQSEAASNLVLSCDVPCIDTSILQQLIEAIDSKTEVVLTESNGQNHPLIAVYQKGCTPTLKKQLDSGERRLRKAVAKLTTKTIQLEGNDALRLRNINTPSEYKALKHEVEH